MKLETLPKTPQYPQHRILATQSSRADLLWMRWCVTGWVIALTLSSTIALIVSAYLVKYRSGPHKNTADLLVVMAAVTEGAVIGYCQWRVLRRLFPTMTKQSWIGVSIVAALFGYCISWLPTSFALMAALATRIGDTSTSPGAIAMFSVVTGALIGLIWGALQFVVLRLHAYRAGSWIIASTLAWMIGFLWLYLAAFIPDRTTTPIVYVSMAALSGLGVGLAIGLIQGRVLVKLRSRLLNQVDLLRRS